MATKYDYAWDPDAENNTAASIYALARQGGPRVLDIGSGPGLIARRLATVDGKQVVCVDFDAEALADAQAGGVQETYYVDLGAPDWFAPLAGRRFDVVVLADVLEHLYSPAALLEAIRDNDLLADDGHLVVSIPNAAHESVLAELMTGHFRYTTTGLLDSTHIRWFTLDSLSTLLESTGFMTTRVHRTLRTVEETAQGKRALQMSSTQRELLGSLGLEARTFQYVLMARPYTAAGQIAALREQVEAALQAGAEDHARVASLRQELTAARREAARAKAQVLRLQERLDAARSPLRKVARRVLPVRRGTGAPAAVPAASTASAISSAPTAASTQAAAAVAATSAVAPASASTRAPSATRAPAAATASAGPFPAAREAAGAAPLPVIA